MKLEYVHTLLLKGVDRRFSKSSEVGMKNFIFKWGVGVKIERGEWKIKERGGGGGVTLCHCPLIWMFGNRKSTNKVKTNTRTVFTFN